MKECILVLLLDRDMQMVESTVASGKPPERFSLPSEDNRLSIQGLLL